MLDTKNYATLMTNEKEFKTSLEVRARVRAYKLKNKENIKVKDKVYREANKKQISEKNKTYRDSNKEMFRERHAAAYQANREERKARLKAQYIKHIDHYKLKAKEWRENNRHKKNAQSVLQTAVKTGKVLREPCVVCGEIKVEGHHFDYTKPLEVIWLCRLHHKRLHAGIDVLEKIYAGY